MTGALLSECYSRDVPATLLVVNVDSNEPDPDAAAAVLDDAIVPMLGFDVDTTVLRRDTDEIRDRMRGIANQFSQRAPCEGDSAEPGMFQ